MAKKKSKIKNQLSILIPVYNEEKTLNRILNKTSFLNVTNYEVIIVDDASTDKSSKIIEEFLNSFKSKHVTVKHFRHSVNKGKGAGIQTGLRYANGEYFVIQDADLEYDPEDIPRLLNSAIGGNHDVVYGSRFLGKINNMPKANYIANRIYNYMLRILYGVKLTDMHTCYKMVRTSIIKNLKINSNRFDYATELVSKLLKSGIKIHEVPIGFNGRTKKDGKKINVLDGIECAYKLILFRFTNKEFIFSEKNVVFWRFVVVGTVGFLINYFLLVILTYFFKIGHIVAELIAAVLAMQITFFLHDSWTYIFNKLERTNRRGTKTRYVSFIVSNSCGMIVTVIVFGILFGALNRLPALFLAALTGLIWNYTINTYIIWQKK